MVKYYIDSPIIFNDSASRQNGFIWIIYKCLLRENCFLAEAVVAAAAAAVVVVVVVVVVSLQINEATNQSITKNKHIFSCRFLHRRLDVLRYFSTRGVRTKSEDTL